MTQPHEETLNDHEAVYQTCTDGAELSESQRLELANAKLQQHYHEQYLLQISPAMLSPLRGRRLDLMSVVIDCPLSSSSPTNLSISKSATLADLIRSPTLRKNRSEAPGDKVGTGREAVVIEFANLMGNT